MILKKNHIGRLFRYTNRIKKTRAKAALSFKFLPGILEMRIGDKPPFSVPSQLLFNKGKIENNNVNQNSNRHVLRILRFKQVTCHGQLEFPYYWPLSELNGLCPNNNLGFVWVKQRNCS